MQLHLSLHYGLPLLPRPAESAFLRAVFATAALLKCAMPMIPQDGKSGFHIDPYHGDEAADKMADFFERCQEEKDYWDTVSQGAWSFVIFQSTFPH